MLQVTGFLPNPPLRTLKACMSNSYHPSPSLLLHFPHTSLSWCSRLFILCSSIIAYEKLTSSLCFLSLRDCLPRPSLRMLFFVPLPSPFRAPCPLECKLLENRGHVLFHCCCHCFPYLQGTEPDNNSLKNKQEPISSLTVSTA